MLPGVLPAYEGMRYRLQNCKECVRLGLMTGAEIELLHIQTSPEEWNENKPRDQLGDLNVLRFMPEACLVRAVDARWTLPTTHLPALPAGFDCRGVFVLRPAMTHFKIEVASKDKLHVRRIMFPLLPASVCIVYGAQGEGWPAVVGDLCCPPGMSSLVHWVANYVILSRAETLDGLLLLTNTTRANLERGAPQYLLNEIDRLLALEKKKHTVVRTRTP